MHTIEQLQSGELAGLRHLKLSCGLTAFPSKIFDLSETLESLDLSGNALTELPDDLARLSKLRIIFCAENNFTALPEVLGRCANLSMVAFKANRIRNVPPGAFPRKLRWLVLTDNQIEELPPEIGACRHLQKLMLAGNRLRTLPASLANCDRLELLRIAANRLGELPAWLLAMPRLSWLAYSGNPFGSRSEADALSCESMDDVPWDALQLEDLLGQGASGVIYRARMDGGDDARMVAVKLFKGAMTSDGLPRSEMAASIRAGKHQNLIGVFGRVLSHPTGIDGLVMQLVDPRCEVLAGPPSLDSCTRDIYAAPATFDLQELLHIALGVASAAEHLHNRGIMHGDLYGHNILHDRRGATFIGDFGAASFYSADDAAMAAGLQRLEVRAFGCLLEELIDRCVARKEYFAVLESLRELRSACLSTEIERRPLFRDIGLRLTDAEQRLRAIDQPDGIKSLA